MPISKSQRNVTNLNALPDLITWFTGGTLILRVEANVSVVRLLADGSFSPSTITFNAYKDDTDNNRVAYAGRFVVATSTDNSTYTTQYTSGADQTSFTYSVPIGVTFVRAQLYKAGGAGTPQSQIVVSIVRDGVDGSSGSGTDAVVVNLSKSAATVFAYADGTVPSFTDIDGQVTVFEGTANETASASFAVAGSGVTGQINTADNTPVAGKPKGYYRVTAMSADIGSLVITTTYNAVDYVRSFSVSKVRTGYEIVGSLPVTNLFQGRLVFLTTDNKLYRYTGTAWTTAVPTVDLSGTITNAQIDALAASKVTGTLTNSQIADLAAAKITGTLTNSQIADLAATKITGTLTNSQIADLAATKITGTITETQIATDAVTSAKIAAGAVITAKLAANAVTANEIASNAITAVKINAGAVETAKLAAGAVTANEIASNAITAIKISAGAVETAKLAANAVTANEIAANAITAAKISAGAVETAKLAAGAVTANEIAANTITASKIAAATITATELATNAITADKISAGAVTAAKISVTSLSAMTANTGSLSVSGTLTLGTSGKIITSGTGYDGNGIFLGEDGAGVYKFSVGGASGRMTFDGTNLTLPGGRLVSGSVGGAAIASSAITSDKISVTNLSAISADLGTVTAGKIALTSGSYVVRHGAGFGASSDLVMWYGLNSVAENSCTKTNGVFALATDGKVYFGSAEYVAAKTQLSLTGPGELLDAAFGLPNTASVSWTAAATGGTSPYTYSWAKLAASGDAFTTSSGSGSSFSATLYGAANKYGTETWSVTVTDNASVSVSAIFTVTLIVESGA